VKVPGDLLDGLRVVSGIRSSLLKSSFFSKDANSGSVSAPPFAPLTRGIEGWKVEVVVGTGAT
jgi:hypothetical protein